MAEMWQGLGGRKRRRPGGACSARGRRMSDRALDQEMPKPEPMAGGETFTHAQPVALADRRLVAQKTGWLRRGQFRGLRQRERSFRRSQTVVDNAPELVPPPPTIGLAPRCRRAQRPQVVVADSSRIETGGELSLRKTRAPRERQVPDIDHLANAGFAQAPHEIIKAAFFVADRGQFIDVHGRSIDTGAAKSNAEPGHPRSRKLPKPASRRRRLQNRSCHRICAATGYLSGLPDLSERPISQVRSGRGGACCPRRRMI